MVEVIFRFPDDMDIATLAAHMRPGDLAEIEAVCDWSPEEALIASIRASDRELLFAAKTADGRLLAIGGCSPHGDGEACPWLLGTDLLDDMPLALTKRARDWLWRMHTKYPYLWNVIDQRQVQTIKWLEGLGFEMVETVVRKEGFPLLRFEMRRRDV